MPPKFLELEVKFYVLDFENIRARLQALGAKLVQARYHEHNLRFDTVDMALTQAGQVVRLRKDKVVRMTYKGAGTLMEGVQRRQEIEFLVDDFEAAKKFLAALGYQVSMIYEKFRTVYALGDTEVTLDEMPFGNFIEIEGVDGLSIRKSSDMLGFKWETRITSSYGALFRIACQNLGMKTNQLTFNAFQGIQVTPDHLGVHPADG